MMQKLRSAMRLLMVMAAALGSFEASRAEPPRTATTGKAIFDRNCAACHAAGRRFPGTAALQAKYAGEIPAALERRTDLTPDIVKYFVRHGVSAMPSFRKTEITDEELEALGGYLAAGRD